jgi:tetratricopeptide (TPR) repeat protein
MALRLDPQLAEAQLALGMYRIYYEWDHKSAERTLKRAIKLNPSLTEAHYHLAWLYEILGPKWEEESLRAGDRTRELSPLSPFMVAWLADQYRDACRYEKALSLAREAIRLDPEHPIGWMTLGVTYSQLGKFDEAIDAHGHLAEKPSWSWVSGTSYAAAGLEDKAREVATALQQYPGTELPLAVLFSQIGDRESALHWISEVEKKRVPWYPALLGWWPGFESIVDDPRLKERAQALNLPDPEMMNCQR